MADSETEIPRSASATSSLDPYYFGTTSRENSPALPNVYTSKESTTPETRHINEPTTPARDPAGIDRKGLIGVGELATPRWGRPPQQDLDDEEREEIEDGNRLGAADEDQDGPDSPWTIEAVNSESDEKDEVCSIDRLSELLDFTSPYSPRELDRSQEQFGLNRQ